MRLALLALPALLCACPVQEGSECSIDQECSGSQVCARDHQCVDPSEVKSVHATWTINGQPADGSTCMGFALEIRFFGNDQLNDSLGFEPVPCEAGVFSVDKLPARYDRVGLRISGGGAEDVARFDADGNAMLDLAF